MKILKMYLLWTLLYLPLAVNHYISLGTPFMKGVGLYIRGFLFIGEQYNSWPLWYLLATVYALIFVWLLLKMKVTPKGILVASFLMSLLSFGIDALVTYKGELTYVLEIVKSMVKYTVTHGRILRGAIYIPIGMYLAYKKIPNSVNWILFCGGFLLNFLVKDTFFSKYLLSITAVGLFGIMENMNLKDSKIYPYLRNMSTCIYLMHMYVWTFYYKSAYGKKVFGMDSFIATSILTMLVAAIWVCFKRRRKKCGNIFT